MWCWVLGVGFRVCVGVGSVETLKKFLPLRKHSAPRGDVEQYMKPSTHNSRWGHACRVEVLFVVLGVGCGVSSVCWECWEC